MYGFSYGCYFFLKGLGELRNNKVGYHFLWGLVCCVRLYLWFVGAKLTLCNKQIYSNATANVCITYGSSPTVASNAIYNGTAEGVSVMQEGACSSVCAVFYVVLCVVCLVACVCASFCLFH
jgi:hypothetical protein